MSLACAQSVGGRSAVLAAALVWAGLLLGAGAPSFALAALGSLVSLPLLVLGVGKEPHLATLSLLAALVLASLARGAASHAVLERADHPGDEPEAGWLRARVVSHPWREGGEPLAIVALDSSEWWAGGTRARLLIALE